MSTGELTGPQRRFAVRVASAMMRQSSLVDVMHAHAQEGIVVYLLSSRQSIPPNLGAIVRFVTAQRAAGRLVEFDQVLGALDLSTWSGNYPDFKDPMAIAGLHTRLLELTKRAADGEPEIGFVVDIVQSRFWAISRKNGDDPPD